MRCNHAVTSTAMLMIGLGLAPLRADDQSQSPPIAGSQTNSTLVGRFLYDGEPPEPAQLTIPLRIRVRQEGLEFDTEELPGRRRIQERGVPDESLIVGDDRGIANVVIWIRSRNIPTPPRDELFPPVTVRAENVRFKPRVLAFWNASPLEWVNESGSAINFNCGALGTNRVIADGQRIEIDVKQSLGIPQALTSNIQPWFKSYLLPLAHPYFAITHGDGRFKMNQLPPGEWDFVVWHERTGWLATDKYPAGRFKFRIKPGENDLGDLNVPPEVFNQRLAGRPALEVVSIKPAATGNSLSELHHAAIRGQSQRAVILIASGANPNEREPRFNGTPLHYAARHGHGEVVQKLIERGARLDARDTNDCTPLIWAIKGGHVDVVRQLLDAEADVDAQNNRGWTALHFAVDRGQVEAAQLLIDHGADLRAKNSEGKTPLELKLDLKINAPSQSPGIQTAEQ